MFGRGVHRLLFTAALVLAPFAAEAAVVEGCDPRVMTAMQATAQARVAASKAIDDEIYDQDDSVLALTCFNQAAAVTAEQAGMIFSGDFRDRLAPVVNDALRAMYANFNTYSLGGRSNAVDYSVPAATMPGGSNVNYDCPFPGRLWDEANGQGIKGGVPYVTFDDLVNGNTAIQPGGGLDGAGGGSFNASWQAASGQGVFTAVQQATDPAMGYPQPSVPVFSDTSSPCAVLLAAGALPSGSTCP